MKDTSGKGFVPVMLTPFKENRAIDFDGLTRLTEWYLQAGAKGLFANCQSSEMYELSDEEKLLIVKQVMKTAGGKVPVVAVGNFGNTLAQQAEFVQKIYDTGVQAVIIVTGLMAAAEENVVMFDEKVFRLFELTGDIPLGFYECPKPYKRVLTAEQLQKFVATGRVIYHKDTCLDIALVREKLEVTKAYPDFGLYDAYAVNAVASLKAGAAGLSCIQGNYFPKLVVWLCENYNNSERSAEVEKVQEFFITNMDNMHQGYPAAAKYCLQKQGLPVSTTVRMQGNIFTPLMQTVIDNLYTNYTVLAKNLRL